MKFTPGLEAGSLNRVVDIQQQSASDDDCSNRDEVGGMLPASWKTVLSCRASIETQNSQLIYATAEFIAEATYRITIRFNPAVTIGPNTRIVYTNPATKITHTYNVKTVLNDQQSNRYLVLLAYEINGQE